MFCSVRLHAKVGVITRHSQSLIWQLLFISLVWGFLLNGFFLYVPFVAELRGLADMEMVVAAGWLSFCAIALLVGRFFSTLEAARRTHFVASAALILVPLALAASAISGQNTVSWLVVNLPLSVILTLSISHVVARAQEFTPALVSAWLGATPLLGLLVISAGFSWGVFRDFYPYLALAAAVAASVPFLWRRNQEQLPPEKGSPAKLVAGSVLSYGFLLGFGVALVNTYVFERIAEVTRADADQVANVGSLLILGASVAGMISSLVIGVRSAQRFSRVAIARVSAAGVALGTLFLLLATDIFLVALAGLLVGIGFGVANGVELRLVQAASSTPPEGTSLFGKFLAVTTLPYVAASLLGLPLALLNLGTLPVLGVALISSVLSILSIRSTSADNQ